MALILNLETSTSVCSVALAEDGNLLSFKEENKGYTHAEKITVFIEGIFREAGKKISDLDSIAVSNGPGSYTGLRIGASTAKGLCYALNIPLISVDTLTLLANQFINFEKISATDLLCPMIDARRMEVYCAIYDSALNEIAPVAAKVIDANSFADLFSSHRVFFFGDGASKCKSIFAQQTNAVILEGITPSASSMVNFSYRKFLNKEFEDTSLYEPFYLKEVLAKRNR